MAQLPPDGDWLIQQIGKDVVLFNRYTEHEIIRFSTHDGDAVAAAQQDIHESELLDSLQKRWAHFWTGYFYATAYFFNQDVDAAS